ncbi:MAG: DUF2442 domain-containing protein [Oscillospiraceae bacterium]|nr:DUF2442 domain-containing protein [Oscillospiraceae bacterium]
MIISENKKPPLEDFKSLMSQTDNLLNANAKANEEYFCKRGGKLLESDVFDAVKKSAIGTPFEGSIQLISGASFPDIVAGNYYGVEVKSTEGDHWTSIGSSILESTRNPNVERIYLTFGKLGKPVQFLSRPYEECLSDIAVTHYPRYRIDMRLESGETIFDKMGIPYDDLRKLDNPVAPVSRYYKSRLKEGESLWWAADDVSGEETAVSATIKLWTALTPQEKEAVTVQGYVLFPEILGKGCKKYNRYALWLATSKGIVNTNIRDSFSAGGKALMRTVDGVEVRMPAAFGRIKKYRSMIEDMIKSADEKSLLEYWKANKIDDNRVCQWCKLVATEASSEVGYDLAWKVLRGIFAI